MCLELHNKKYWEYVPTFIKRVVCLPMLGVVILGYFPYHTARVKAKSTNALQLPRLLFEEFEKLLVLNNINDNKAVYICYPGETNTSAQPFAIMFKDDYVLIGTWNEVTNYDGTPLKIK